MRTNQLSSVVALTIIFTSLLATAYGGKILLMCMQRSGHLSEFAGLAEGLLARGHKVYMVLDEHLKEPSVFKGLDVTFMRYKSMKPEMMDTKKFDETQSKLILEDSESPVLALNRVHVTYDCLSTVEDKELFKRMQQEKFDFAVVEGMYFCYHIIPHNLGIPYGQLSSPLYSWLVRIHPLSGFTACALRGKKNTFFNRLQFFVVSMIFENMVSNAFLDESKMLPHANPPVSSLRQLAKNSSLYIINLNNVIDCARPSMPNLIYVGGIAAKPPKPLPADIKEFVDSAKEGFIICTFGSMMAKAPRHIQEKLLKVFSMVKQKVLWRQEGIPADLKIPDNVRPMSWLPQNDLLAHPNVKVFITHNGNNGQTEAVYHGVPMLGVPLAGDQFGNTDRSVELGYGLKANIKTDSPEEIASLVKELIDNPKYETAVNKASLILKSVPPAKDTAAYWVEHVMKYGGSHLRTTLADMSDIQFIMFDIYAFLTILLFVSLFLLKKIVCFIYRKFAGDEAKSKKKKTN
ncbi:UDP-glucuronosyltransferase 2C1-like [Lineus longissimus]|uniref:UDP-glucuronosyltransferase 2C1-like n=1 Tax=Lineus longissimus TaxID=88925 RepID=UPI00315D774B